MTRNDKRQIEHLITLFNQNSLGGKAELLSDILHADVVFVAPDLQNKLIGKVACLQSIVDYQSQARTLEFEVEKRDITIWDTTANVMMTYRVKYEYQEKIWYERGQESWILTQDEHQWKICWRAVLRSQAINDQ